ncbi:hypothetical protein [Deinococcus peraridilitoris]|uniref:Uncharacterized protein n=1 Tax=Deinococcus peraridilitoris (strain DSM 19664 / LMG 22246 / CIP 109416 / KR-200) TaxID=937777 RepID=K9ZZJ9_DEIPD|nr:hypothetical protein [Deinococcus peraridilitoris]AFZ66599.1 hypothetical protein Deipe_1035 [Deinococcus peraridilitoris DSM 19664]
MKFLVRATPRQVPMLPLISLRRTHDWHEQHAGLGCMMQLPATGELAGLLEAADESELRLALDAYPDRECYAWTVTAALPMSEACTRDLSARTTRRPARPCESDLPGSVFPFWMTGKLPEKAERS